MRRLCLNRSRAPPRVTPALVLQAPVLGRRSWPASERPRRGHDPLGAGVTASRAGVGLGPGGNQLLEAIAAFAAEKLVDRHRRMVFRTVDRMTLIVSRKLRDSPPAGQPLCALRHSWSGEAEERSPYYSRWPRPGEFRAWTCRPTRAGDRCSQPQTPSGISDARTGTGFDPHTPNRIAVVGAGRAGGSIARAAAGAGLSIDARRPRRNSTPSAADAEVALLCVPDSAIADARASGSRSRCRRLRLVGHTSGAIGLDALDPARARGAETFVLHPLQTLPDADLRPHRRRRARSAAPSPEARRACASSLAERLGMRPFELADEAARRLPRRRIDRLQLPRRPRGIRRRAARRAAGVEDARELLAPLVLAHGGELVRARRRGADRADRPRRRGHRRAPPAGAARERARAAPPLRGARRAHAGARACRAEATTMRIVRTKAELRDALDAAAPRGSAGSASCRPWAPCTRGTCRCCAPRASDCDVVVMSLFVNPAQFGPGEDLDRYPRDEARDAASAEEAGVDLIYAPAVDRGLPRRLRDLGRGRGRAHRGARAAIRASAAPSTSAASPRSSPSSSTRSSPTSPTSARRTPSRRSSSGGWRADLDFPVRIEVLPTVREPDGLAMSSRNAYLSDERTRSRRGAQARARGREALRGRWRANRRRRRRRAGRARALPGSSPSTSRRATQTTSPRATSFNGRPVLVAVAARVGKTRLIDNIVIGGN